MEKENKVPTDLRKRWIIATLLNIPPAYFGLTALKPALPQSDEIIVHPSTDAISLDMKGYNARLRKLWTSWTTYYAQGPVEFLEEITGRIQALEQAFVYGGAQQRQQMSLMLCNYLVLFGNIRRDQGYLASALIYLDKAIALAKDRGYNKLCAKALYLRGYVFFDIWSIRQKQDSITDLQRAIDDFQAALTYTREEKRLQGL